MPSKKGGFLWLTLRHDMPDNLAGEGQLDLEVVELLGCCVIVNVRGVQWMTP